jgi:hypothetical protein
MSGCYVTAVKLADRVAQCQMPLVVRDGSGGRTTVLNNTADCAVYVARCPVRYVISDDLSGLCADLAYSKGARSLACADLLHVPAEVLWVEWCNRPWQSALQRHGFPLTERQCQWVGRRGALIRSSLDGRRGLLRTFWTVATEREALTSSVEAYFDFDTPEGEEPEAPDREKGQAINVYDSARAGDDVLGRCFRFRYEPSWADYYQRAGLSDTESEAVWRHALGTIALDVPMLLAFFLLLATRAGLPQRPLTFERLNRSRLRCGKGPLLDHIEVRTPLLPQYRDGSRVEGAGTRRSPRLHHVRGHLVRRGNQLFWRVPHLRGSARAGTVRSRTVVWTFDDPLRRRSAVTAALTPASSSAAGEATAAHANIH